MLNALDHLLNRYAIGLGNLASVFVKLGDENNLEVIGLTNTDPLEANDLGATYENKNTFFDLGNMTLFAALSFDQLAKKYA